MKDYQIKTTSLVQSLQTMEEAQVEERKAHQAQLQQVIAQVASERDDEFYQASTQMEEYVEQLSLKVAGMEEHKVDLENTLVELNKELYEMGLASQRQQYKHQEDLNTTKTEYQGEITATKTRLKEEVAAVQTEVAALKTREALLEEQLAAARKELEEKEASARDALRENERRSQEERTKDELTYKAQVSEAQKEIQWLHGQLGGSKEEIGELRDALEREREAFAHEKTQLLQSLHGETTEYRNWADRERVQLEQEKQQLLNVISQHQANGSTLVELTIRACFDSLVLFCSQTF